MKPQELRIDNYVQYKSETGIVREINHRDVFVHIPDKKQNDRWAYTGEQLQGIELTEQWLKDFGFEKRGDERVLKRVIKDHCDQEFTFFDFADSMGMRINNYYGHPEDVCSYVVQADIDHVHTLQNLYWCLCGKELQRKTTKKR